MRSRAPLALAILLSGGISASAKSTLSPKAVEGVWRVVSLQSSFDGGPPEQVLGSKPNGYIAFLPNGRMFAILTAEGRKPAQTDEDRAKLLSTMTAYTGKYHVENDKIVTKIDISWNESWNGIEQTRMVTISGDRMHVEAIIPSVIHPSKKATIVAEYKREK